jgi:hypothetical protein
LGETDYIIQLVESVAKINQLTTRIDERVNLMSLCQKEVMRKQDEQSQQLVNLSSKTAILEIQGCGQKIEALTNALNETNLRLLKVEQYTTSLAKKGSDITSFVLHLVEALTIAYLLFELHLGVH